MTLGPVQILVLGFDEPKFEGKILEELKRLGEHDIVRVVDVIAVHKHDDGTVERLEARDLAGERQIAAALMGLEEDSSESSAEVPSDVSDAESWYIDDAIPPGTAAAVVVLEHRWAIPLRDAIRDTGGFYLADAWVHPADLASVGLEADAAAVG